MLVFALLIFTVFILICYWYTRRPQNEPPGPRGFPLLGIMPYLDKHPERIFAKWSEHYGPVMTVPMGPQKWVILNDYTSIYKALVKNGSSFSGRPGMPFIDIITKGLGLSTVDYGDFWKTQRKFGMMTLRGFGVGTKSIEDKILEEADYFNEELRKQNGKAFDMAMKLGNTVSNVICSVVFGRRFPYGHPWFTKMLEYLNKWFGNPTENYKFGLLIFMPQLRFIPPFTDIVNDLEKDVKFVMDSFMSEVEKHEEEFREEDIRDFIDAFLLEMKNNKETFSKHQLIHYVHDLFQAGTETVTSTLRWSILCFLHYPESQQKFYKEVIQIMGEDGRPSMSIKSDMPYCSAFIEEVGRYRTLVPLGVFHKTTEDVMLNGYRIAKDTTIAPNMWAVHNDPKLWDEPNKFKPERHLDSDGNFIKSKYVIPFGIGPRYCLGEQLAKMELFLFLTSMVQKFEFLPNPDDKNLPEMESSGPVFLPRRYKVVAKERGSR